MADAVVRVALVASGAGNEIVATSHYRLDEGIFFAADTNKREQVELLATELRDDLVPKWAALIGSDYIVEGVSVNEEVDPNSPSAVGVQAYKAAGTAGTASSSYDVPRQLCGMLRFKTDLAGRSFRGRQFLPPVRTVGHIVGSGTSLGGAYLTAANAYVTQLGVALSFGLFGTGDIKQVVYSPTRRKRALTPYMADVTNVSVDPRVHYLRSRVD